MEVFSDALYDVVFDPLDKSWRDRVLDRVSDLSLSAVGCRDIFYRLLNDIDLWEIPYRGVSDDYEREWYFLVNEWRSQVFARSEPHWSTFEGCTAVDVLEHLFAFDDVWVGAPVDIDVFYSDRDFKEWFERVDYEEWASQLLYRAQQLPEADVSGADNHEVLNYLLDLYHLWDPPCRHGHSHAWFQRYRKWKKDLLSRIPLEKGDQHALETLENLLKCKDIFISI